MNYSLIRQRARLEGIPALANKIRKRMWERVEQYNETSEDALEYAIQNLKNPHGLTDAELKADGGDEKFYKPVQLNEVAA